MEEILTLSPSTKVIVVTGTQDYEHAIRAVALGAYDFYQKPVNTAVLDLIVERAFQMFASEQQNRTLQQQTASPLAGFIANDQAMLALCRSIEKIAPTDITCLITGESGTGKEVLSRALHTLSGRTGPFVAINCAAIPETLIESELFGYEKGSFTGADKMTIGKVEAAQNGTLFLDELGDMPLSIQVKMLRFLQEHKIERIGGRREIPVDVRIVCATNKNLRELVDKGEFREDLYFRVCEVQLEVPPLRKRGGDKILLARYLLQRFAATQNLGNLSFSEDALAAIDSHPWPGNVREMENKVKHGAIMAEEKVLTPDDLGLMMNESLLLNLRMVRENSERDAISQALAIADGKIAAAAKLLGITRPTLYDLMNKYNMRASDDPEDNNLIQRR